jgi:hypothetical protein
VRAPWVSGSLRPQSETLDRGDRGPNQTRRRLQSAARRTDRHHNEPGQAQVRDVCRPRRVRARRDPGALNSQTRRSACQRPEGRAQAGLHSFEASPCSGGYDEPRHACLLSLRGTGDLQGDALQIRHARRQADGKGRSTPGVATVSGAGAAEVAKRPGIKPVRLKGCPSPDANSGLANRIRLRNR